MSWIARKFDNLGAAVIGGGLAAVASQAPAFAAAYLQRLGGRVDEARDTLARIQSGEMVPNAAPSVIHDLTVEQTHHLSGLEAQYTALQSASPAWRPIHILLDMDPQMANRAFADFTPALPLDTGGAIWVVGGLIIGLVLWELLKAPFTLAWSLAGQADRKAAKPASAQPTAKRRKEPHL